MDDALAVREAVEAVCVPAANRPVCGRARPAPVHGVRRANGTARHIRSSAPSCSLSRTKNDGSPRRDARRGDQKMAGADDGAHEPDAARRACARAGRHRRAAALERSEHARTCPWGHEAYKNPLGRRRSSCGACGLSWPFPRPRCGRATGGTFTCPSPSQGTRQVQTGNKARFRIANVANGWRRLPGRAPRRRAHPPRVGPLGPRSPRRPCPVALGDGVEAPSARPPTM